MWVYIFKTLTISTHNIIKIGLSLLRKWSQRNILVSLRVKNRRFNRVFTWIMNMKEDVILTTSV